MIVMNKDKVYIEDLLDSDVEYNRVSKDNQKVRLFCFPSQYKLLKGEQNLYIGFDCREAVLIYNNA